MKKLSFLTLLFCLTAINAHAADWLHPYVGVDYAFSKAGYGNFADKILEDKTDSYILSAGVKVLPGLAIEGFYQESAKEDHVALNAILTGDHLNSELSIKAYGVDVVKDVINLGLVEVLSSIGLARYDVKVAQDYAYNNGGGHSVKTYHGQGIRFGLGGQINLGDSWSIRGMGRYSLTDVEKINDFKEVTIGLRYNF